MQSYERRRRISWWESFLTDKNPLKSGVFVGCRQKPFNKKVNSQYGAPMGRINNFESTRAKIYLERVPLNEGYDRGGAYWGSPNNLYCAYSKNNKFVYFFRLENYGEYNKAREQYLSIFQMLNIQTKLFLKNETFVQFEKNENDLSKMFAVYRRGEFSHYI